MSLSRWQRSIVTEAGDTIAEAEIEVFDAGESTKPDLFQDSDGSIALTNPFNADGVGFAAFYVAGGRYDIAVNGAVIWTDVALGTVQSRDVGTGADEVPDISALESALGIDTEGPAGDDVLAAVGRGAIVESDTNDNGSYVRWGNGEQLCWRNYTQEITVDTAFGEIFRADIGDLEFPASFSASSSYSVALMANTSSRCWASTSSNDAESFSARVFSGVSFTETARLQFLAWGTWK